MNDPIGRLGSLIPALARMLAGADALSDSEGLVVFTSRCWKSDRGFYNRFTQTFTPAAGVTMTQEEQDSYVSAMKKLVDYKLESTARIVENTIAMMRTRSTSMPAALATTPF